MENFDQKIGVQIIENALRVPMRTIASNAGVEGAVIVGKALDLADPSWGYNAAAGEFTDMVKAGIIDPLKVGGVVVAGFDFVVFDLLVAGVIDPLKAGGVDF